MQFGIVGLGRIGANLARLALEQGHQVVGFNEDKTATRRLARAGLERADSIADLVSRLQAPRVIFAYVPHGAPTDEVCDELAGLLETGDVAVDGGNSHWNDSERRHAIFARAGIGFLDIGTSGGLEGARHGSCFMAGGDEDAFRVVAPLLRDLAVDDEAVLHVGPPGSGHFAKLVHNAIEFGMLQAIGEGVELLTRSSYDLDLHRLFVNWSHGSVIRSWLVELMAEALRKEPGFKELSTFVEDTDEVKWVLKWGLDEDIPTPVIALSQNALMRDRDPNNVASKAIALMRHGFGGHPLHRDDEDEPRGRVGR